MLSSLYKDAIKVVTVRSTAFAEPIKEVGNAIIDEGIDPKVDSSTAWVSKDLTKSDRPELASAERVVSGGRGLKSKEEFDRII